MSKGLSNTKKTAISFKYPLIFGSIAVVCGLGIFVYNRWIKKTDTEEGKYEVSEEELSKLDRSDFLELSYGYIYDEILVPNGYKKDPIDSFSFSGVDVSENKVSYIQEDYAVARFWDFIYASRLYGDLLDKSEISKRAESARDFLYENAFPFNEGDDAKYLSTNKVSVCYPLKYLDLIDEDEKEFYVSSCTSQYKNFDSVVTECINSKDVGPNELISLVKMIRFDNSEGIDTFVKEYSLNQGDRGDISVDYFILASYLEELMSFYEEQWDSLGDNTATATEISGQMKSVSTDSDKLEECLYERGFRSIAESLVNIYENSKKQSNDDGTTDYSFSRTETYTLINSLLYIEKMPGISEDFKTAIDSILAQLLGEDIHYYNDFGYGHGMSEAALLEMCLSGNVMDLDNLPGDKYEGACPYVESTYEKMKKGNCEEDDCNRYLVYNEEYEDEEGESHYSASSADTLRVLFDLLMIQKKNDVQD